MMVSSITRTPPLRLGMLCLRRRAFTLRFGFEFGEFGFALNHVHFQVNIPKRYSVETAEIMLKSRSAKKMFEIHPGFRKRYPRGSFWSGYEHHASTGLMKLDESSKYLQDQQRHHGVNIISSGQQQLSN